MQNLYAWRHKGGNAHEFVIGDSNYRVWKPTISAISTGLTVIFKFDHIRTAARDDHAVVMLEFNDDGKIVSQKTLIEFQGKGAILKVMDIRKEVMNGIAGVAQDPMSQGIAAATKAADGVQRLIMEELARAPDNGGGRGLFPRAVYVTAFESARRITESLVKANLGSNQ